MRFWDTDHFVHLGAKAAVLFGDGCGPVNLDDDGSTGVHSMHRRYATAVGLDLPTNMLYPGGVWWVVTTKSLLMTRPGPLRQMPEELLLNFPLTNCALHWLEHTGSDGVGLVMMHLVLPDGRFALGDVSLDHDGDAEGFINAFGSHQREIDRDIQQAIRVGTMSITVAVGQVWRDRFDVQDTREIVGKGVNRFFWAFRYPSGEIGQIAEDNLLRNFVREPGR